MHFLVTGYDGADENALHRRMRAREQHIAIGDRMVAQGTYLFGAALLDDHDKMIGSSMVMDFPSRAELDEWLAYEPYVLGNVWARIDVCRCAVGPSFTAKLISPT